MADRGEYISRWPQFGLFIALDGAHLAAPTDSEVAILTRSASQPAAVLRDGEAHFVKWIDGRTPDEIERQRAERIHSNRELIKRPGWTLDLAVFVHGEPVGLQSLSGFAQWPQRRIVGTTSWLLAPFQRRGLGARCRAAVLELAFAHLDVEVAKSWALEDNASSNAVSARLGYRQIDRHTLVEDGREFVETVWEIASQRWLNSAARQHYAPIITGAEKIKTLLDVP